MNSKRHFAVLGLGFKLVVIGLVVAVMAGVIPPAAVGVVSPSLAELLPKTPAALAAGTISGAVFRDFNSDGIKSTGVITDTGVQSVTVTVYDTGGVVRGSAVTNASGAYSVSATGTGPYRVEFTDLPAGFYPSARSTDSVNGGTATNSGSTVQFVPDGSTSNVNLAINEPCDYCQDNNPWLITSNFMNGDPTAAGPGAQPVLQAFRWNYQGLTTSAGYIAPTTVATLSQVGSTWGKALNRQSRKLYSSALVQRYTGLGPLGLGGIYAVDVANPASPVLAPSFDLDLASAPYNIDFGSFPTVARNLATTVSAPARDTEAFTATAKVGIGDIDFTPDGSALFVVNLFNRSLVKVDFTNGVAASSASEYPLVGASGVPVCVNGELRPWALRLTKSTGYVGVVCDASAPGGTTSDLIAYVLSFDPAAPSSFTQVLSIPMNYPRQNVAVTPAQSANWKPFTDTFNRTTWQFFSYSIYGQASAGSIAYPMPLLSDIEIDDSGALILGFLDRAGLMVFGYSYSPNTGDNFLYQLSSAGDILRACPSGSGWTLENNTACSPTVSTPSASTNSGPGGGEYYYQDNYPTEHPEVAVGGLAYLPGSNKVATSAYDPAGSGSTGFNGQGVIWMNSPTGARSHGYQLSVGTINSVFGPSGVNARNGRAAKGAGIGDLEVLCNPAPIELGNRVWLDSDGDGIQDPNEAAISGVVVELYKNGVKVGQATTDANGEYYFVSGTNASDANTNDNIIHDGGIGILPDTAYEVRIDTTQPALSGLGLTTQNGSDANHASNNSNSPITDTVDSDAALNGVNAVIAYTTGGSGENNHGLDYGFASYD